MRLLLHSNSAINAWIYAYRLREFRNIIKQDCLALACCRQRADSHCCTSPSCVSSSTCCSCPPHCCTPPCSLVERITCCYGKEESRDVNNSVVTNGGATNAFQTWFEQEVNLKDEELTASTVTSAKTAASVTSQTNNNGSDRVRSSSETQIFTVSRDEKTRTVKERRDVTCRRTSSCDSGNVSDSEIFSSNSTQKSLTL